VLWVLIFGQSSEFLSSRRSTSVVRC
jgi:hypothetical protein